VHSEQEETFVVLGGRLTGFLGEPPERHEGPAGGIVHVRAGAPLQAVNEGEENLLRYADGLLPTRAPTSSPPPCSGLWPLSAGPRIRRRRVCDEAQEPVIRGSTARS
jgi:hypothetical protein